MGLASVRRIAAQHGGTVRISSELGAGTTVRLTIPRADDEVTPAE
ncbi:ATP-binding protein [Acinetobacter baumannii]